VCIMSNILLNVHRSMLQLGCGAGLPGIYALLHGAVVHFQDYVRQLLS